MRNVVIVFLFALNYATDGYRILGLFPIPIKSHSMFYDKLMLELSKSGHEVDVVTHFPDSNAPYNEYSLSGSLPSMENNVSIEYHDYQTVMHVAAEFIQLGNTACRAALSHPVAKQLKETKVKYDLIITEMFATDCLLPYAHLFNAPIIGISSSSIMPWADDRMGNPDNPAYISNYFVARSGKLNFLEKVEITIANIFSKVWYYLLSTIPAEIRGRELFGDIPTIENIAKNTHILLANRHFSLDDPRPLVPGVVEIGGLHIEKPKQLSSEFEIIMSSKAVILFSMGTLVNMATFSEERMSMLMKYFATLPYQVIIRGEKEDFQEKLPKNVHVFSWVPQVDILCHPHTKLFVTHGGTLSIQEAAYCAVPIVGIPFYPNHELNIRNYARKNAGVLLHYYDFSDETIAETFNSVLKNDTYSSNAALLSTLFKDRPISAKETATYWVEYVLRNGGEHMRTRGADLIFFEYFLVDVLIVVGVMMIMAAIVMFFVLNFLQDLFDRPPPPKEHEKEKVKSN